MVFPKVLWFCCGFNFWGFAINKLGPEASSCRLFTQLSSNNVGSTITHIVHHKTCSVSPHAQTKNGSQEKV